jgi:multiple sugar transport system substrate-binding protein
MARRMSLIAMTLAAALVASACSDDATARTRVVLQVFADPAEASAYQELIGAFEQANEDVEVKLVPVGSQGDHVAKLSTDFSAGNPPDIFLINYRRFGQFAGSGALEPLGARLARSKVFKEEDLFPQAVDAFRFEGTLMCLPQNISTPVVYWNRELFNEAGLSPPAEGWDWNDMLEAAKALTKDDNGDGIIDIRGIGFEPSLNRFAPFIWQAGGTIVDDLENPTKMSLFDPGAIEALRFLAELQYKHHVVPTRPEFESEDPEHMFANGRLGMLIESRRATTALRVIEDLDWDVAPLPVHPERREPVVMLHSDAYCMAKSSAVKGAAFRFVEFALGPEGAPILSRTGRTVPSLRSVAESDAFLDLSQPPESAQVFLDQIPAIQRFPNIAAWNEIESKADPIVEEWSFSNEPPQAFGLEISVATLELLLPET